MGPMLLFDKSSLQGLKENEAIWLDHFFNTVISPIFFVETLADLEKQLPDRTAEREVAIIASKTPEAHAHVNVFHGELIVANLMGQYVPLDGRPVVPGVRVEVPGHVASVTEPQSELEAFARWQDESFLEVERRFARAWRTDLRRFSLKRTAAEMRRLDLDLGSCRSIQDLVCLARSTVERDSEDVVRAALRLLQVPLEREVLQRWRALGMPTFAEFAPYAAFVVTIDLALYCGVSRGFISSERASNKVDVAYLYYLPFCSVFTSGDRLHRMLAPQFLRDDQEFVEASDLKRDLHAIEAHYAGLPEDERERGLDSIARTPPPVAELTTRLWDRYLPGWNDVLSGRDEPMSDDVRRTILERTRRLGEAVRSGDTSPVSPADDVDGVMMQRRVRPKRGNWWQLPKSLSQSEK